MTPKMRSLYEEMFDALERVGIPKETTYGPSDETLDWLVVCTSRPVRELHMYPWYDRSARAWHWNWTEEEDVGEPGRLVWRGRGCSWEPDLASMVAKVVQFLGETS